MKLLPRVSQMCVVVGMLLSQLSAEPIFYNVLSGENYEKSEWKRAETKLDFEKRAKHLEVFESYTVKSKDGKISQVERSYSTPSGDWGMNLTYDYNKEGDLVKVTANFNTFSGYDAESDKFHPTRSVRIYIRDKAGKLQQTEEKIYDLKSEKEVNRSFMYPEMKHWEKVNDLPAKGL